MKVDGKTHYLGKHGSDESKRQYAELIKQWCFEQSGRLYPVIALGALALLNKEFAQGYYVKYGKPTTEVARITVALKPLFAFC